LVLTQSPTDTAWSSAAGTGFSQPALKISALPCTETILPASSQKAAGEKTAMAKNMSTIFFILSPALEFYLHARAVYVAVILVDAYIGIVGNMRILQLYFRAFEDLVRRHGGYRIYRILSMDVIHHVAVGKVLEIDVAGNGKVKIIQQ
jgi:hypothetical protein